MPLPEIVDCHTHTFFSDGEGTFEENVRAALAARCTTLASTDHLTLPREMDPDCECSVPETDLNEHRESFLNVQEQAAAGEFGEAGKHLELVYGFEADWYEGCEANIARWRGDAVFLLGSIHFIDGMAIDYDKEMDIWDDWGPDAVWRAYVERWCRACFCGRDGARSTNAPSSVDSSPARLDPSHAQSDPSRSHFDSSRARSNPSPAHFDPSRARFDSMAHPDLVKLFSSSGYAPSIPLEPLWDQMAEAAREAGVHVELSTAGLRKPCADFYPAAGLLERFQRAGVPLTVGSDGHTPGTICWEIKRAYAFAHAAGYRSIDAPTATGEWRTIAL